MTESGKHTGAPAVVASEIDEATEARERQVRGLKWSAIALGCFVITVGLAGRIILRDGFDQLTGEVLLLMSTSLVLTGVAAVDLLRRSRHLSEVIAERQDALSDEIARTESLQPHRGRSASSPEPSNASAVSTKADG